MRFLGGLGELLYGPLVELVDLPAQGGRTIHLQPRVAHFTVQVVRRVDVLIHAQTGPALHPVGADRTGLLQVRDLVPGKDERLQVAATEARC